MSQDLNTVALVGRLTKNVEMRYSNSGFAFGNFSLAVNRKVKQQDGSWQDKASFFEVKLIGKMAEGLAQYLTKGKQVSVKGYLEQETWQQDGQNRSKVVVMSESISLLGSKQGSQGNQGQSQQTRLQQQNYKPQGQYQAHSNQNSGKNYQNQGNINTKPVYNAPENFESDDFDGF